MKEKKTLQQKLTERKYKQPNRIIYGLYYHIGSIIMKKYKFNLTVRDDINKEPGPCFLIWNHLSRLDHFFLMKAAYPKKINILAGYSEFFRSHLHLVFRLMNIIPKKVFTNDIAGIRAIYSIINKGGCVCFSPEGMSSLYGSNQPVVPGSGRFIKHFGIPVYYLNIKGAYLTSTKMCLDERIGRIDGELSLLFTPEQLESMSADEVEAAINAAFRHDDYEWQKEEHIRWKDKKGRMCHRYNTVCYKCPKCGAEFTMESEGNEIRCKNCGNGAMVNEYYEFVPFDKDCVLPESPSKWLAWEREGVIRDIRADENYSFSENVKVGYLPPYKCVNHMKTSEPCGEGRLTADHSGIHFTGTKLGEPWSFDLSYSVVYSLVVMTDMGHYGLYVNEEFYEFYPETPSTGKMLLVIEEMHRLHENIWKNFPWNDYMYENL